MILIGDVREQLRTLDAGTVQCVVTSPPYWGLRDYGVEGQIGLEPTPDAYIETMVGVFREVRRVLRDDGTVFCNIGDSYASTSGEKTNHPQQSRKGQQGVVGPRTLHPSASRANLTTTKQYGDLKPKDLCLIPFRLALALQADGWYVRSDIIWAKGLSFCPTYAGSVMPESVTDRPTTSHEHVFLLTKNASYYYDAEAVRETAKYGFSPGPDTWGRARAASATDKRQAKGGAVQEGAGGTRNLRTVWAINPQPFSEAHFATFPLALVEPCIQAGSRPGDLVLDPFLGSGTTAIVAKRLGRRVVGIELNPDYARMASEQIDGPLFAEVPV